MYNSVPIDSLPLPVMLVSNSHQVLAANSKAKAIFSEIAPGKHIAAIFGEGDLLQLCAEVAVTGQARDCEVIRKKPSKRRFQVSIGPFENDDAKGVFLAFYETTATHEAERMRSSFVADVSHELRSPLTTMIATIETLKGSAGEKAEVRARFIDLMADETNRMHRIVDDLLSLSATEAMVHIAPEDAVNLVPIIESVAEVLALKAENKNMAIKLKLEEGLPDILGKKDELYQAIYNLADNAIKYGPENSTVTLGVKSRGEEVIFKTRNYGDPIRKKHIPRLTERFYRADKSRSRDLGGTGLGLAIVKHILNRHMGVLEISSGTKKGTVFLVRFPKI